MTASRADVRLRCCRLGRTVRDEDQLGPLRSACFAGGLLALGSHAGELRLADAATGVTVAAADNEHTAAVNTLRSWQVSVPATPIWLTDRLKDAQMLGFACASHVQQNAVSPGTKASVEFGPECQRTAWTHMHTLVSLCILFYRAATAARCCCCQAAGGKCGSGT